MNFFWMSFASLVIMVASLTAFATLRQPRLVQAGVIAMMLCVIGSLWLSMVQQQGQPKMASLELLHRNATEATLLSSQMAEGVAIYVWYRLPGESKPLAYELPWSTELAQQIQDAERKAGKSGSGVKVRMPFERSYDPYAPKFYEAPMPALPEKELSAPQQEEPQHYTRPNPERAA